MSVLQANNKLSSTLANIGRGALASIFPEDIEYYMMAIELVTGETGETIDYFMFPVMPEQIQKSEPQRVNVKKTSNGVTRLVSATFAPQELSVKGNFGREFKIFISPKEPALSGVAFSYNKGAKNLIASRANAFKGTFAEFYPGVKSGFGAIRMLKGILNKANGVDADGTPFKLYLYNMALGESYLVSVSPAGVQVSQNMEKNMIWDYSVTFDILSPLENIVSSEHNFSLGKAAAFSEIQKGINTAVKNLSSAIR